MAFLKINEKNIANFKKSTRFNFVWTVVLGFTIAAIVLTILSTFLDIRFFLFYVVALFFLVVSLLFLRYKSNYYRLIASLLFIFIFLICIVSIFTVKNDPHFQELFWMLGLSIFSFFVLNQRWGISFLVAIVVIYCIYYNFFFAEHILQHHFIKPHSYLSWSIEFGISMFIIGYAMTQYIVANHNALNKIKVSYKELEDQKRKVEQQTKEKTILLQEIHHRVKNNLQVIVSLLRMQMKELSSPEAQNSFQMSISRVISMALIHQKLYEKENLSDIVIKEYLEALLERIVPSRNSGVIINYTVHSSITNFTGRNALPLGLLVNELVLHTLNKVNQEEASSASIEVHIKAIDEHRFTMTYIDDKIHSSTQVNSYYNSIQLIDIFSRQLDGNYTVSEKENKKYYQFVLLTG